MGFRTTCEPSFVHLWFLALGGYLLYCPPSMFIGAQLVSLWALLHVTLIRLWFSPNVEAHLLTELVHHQLSFMVQFRSHWALPIVLSLFLLNA